MVPPTTTPIVEVELSPMSRASGIVYLDSIELDADQDLGIDDLVELLDEGRAIRFATVVDKREARYGGHKYTLQIS